MISFLSFFLPTKIEEFDSKFNGRINVEEIRGEFRVIIDGLSQSGGRVKSLWRKALAFLTVEKVNPKKILILGLGSGTLAKLLSEKYPESEIIGVEIDPLMIEIGNKYFFLSKINKLKIINGDAINFLESLKNEKFDLIFVDVYKGELFPSELEKPDYLKIIFSHITDNGIVIYNRLYYTNHVSEAEIFLDKMREIFKYINCKGIDYNLIIFAKDNPFNTKF